MSQTFARKDILTDRVYLRGCLAQSFSQEKEVAVLTQFRHKQTRQRVFCVLISVHNHCFIISSEIDIIPKPHKSNGENRNLELKLVRADGKSIVLVFTDKVRFLNWQKCTCEALAEVLCCEAMMPQVSGRLSAVRMTRCINTCKQLTREARLLGQVQRLRSVRTKVNAIMQELLEKECCLDKSNVQKVRSSCGFMRCVFPSLQRDPDLVFLSEDLRGGDFAADDLEGLCRLLLSIQQEDKAEFLRMVRQSCPDSVEGNGVGDARSAHSAGSLQHLLKIPPLVLRSSSPEKAVNKGTGSKLQSRIRRSEQPGSGGSESGTGSSASSSSLSPTPKPQSARGTPRTAKKKSVTWDASVDQPVTPSSSAAVLGSVRSRRGQRTSPAKVSAPDKENIRTSTNRSLAVSAAGQCTVWAKTAVVAEVVPTIQSCHVIASPVVPAAQSVPSIPTTNGGIGGDTVATAVSAATVSPGTPRQRRGGRTNAGMRAAPMVVTYSNWSVFVLGLCLAAALLATIAILQPALLTGHVQHLGSGSGGGYSSWSVSVSTSTSTSTVAAHSHPQQPLPPLVRQDVQQQAGLNAVSGPVPLQSSATLVAPRIAYQPGPSTSTSASKPAGAADVYISEPALGTASLPVVEGVGTLSLAVRYEQSRRNLKGSVVMSSALKRVVHVLLDPLRWLGQLARTVCQVGRRVTGALRIAAAGATGRSAGRSWERGIPQAVEVLT